MLLCFYYIIWLQNSIESAMDKLNLAEEVKEVMDRIVEFQCVET